MRQNFVVLGKVVLVLLLLLAAGPAPRAARATNEADGAGPLRVGWAATDITLAPHAGDVNFGAESAAVASYDDFLHFELRFHHGLKDPMAMALWKKGQQVTCIKVLRDKPVTSIVTGSVIDMRTPLFPRRHGGSCTQQVRWKPDGNYDVLKHPDIGGHHHVLPRGNWKKELTDFRQLFKITAVGTRSGIRGRFWRGEDKTGKEGEAGVWVYTSMQPDAVQSPP